jgi:hypothetical protein
MTQHKVGNDSAAALWPYYGVPPDGGEILALSYHTRERRRL